MRSSLNAIGKKIMVKESYQFDLLELTLFGRIQDPWLIGNLRKRRAYFEFGHQQDL